MASDENTLNGESGPGSQLRIARESKQISLEEISRATHISVSKLQALEENRFDTLGPQPFVIGYIRKCAKILGIESDSLVEAYKQQAGVADDLNAAPGLQTGSGRGGPGPATIAGRNIVQTVRHIPVWWIVGGLVAVWIGGVYFLVPGEEQRPALRPTVQEAEEATRIETATPESSVGEQSISQEPVVDDEDDADPVEPEAIPDAQVTVNAPGNTPAGSSNSGSAVESVRPPGATELSTTERSATELSATDIDQEGQDLLVMNFTDSCWVEVRDANDSVVFAALQTPADTLQLYGKSPFTVMLGNAHAVSLAINGRPVDTQPRAGRDTLRLTVAP